jgi:hypothetical protein
MVRSFQITEFELAPADHIKQEQGDWVSPSASALVASVVKGANEISLKDPPTGLLTPEIQVYDPGGWSALS